MRIPVRLVGPAHLANSTATIYTSPTNQKTIIRRIDVSNPTGGAVTYTLGIGADAAGTRMRDAKSLAAGATETIYGPITLEAGDLLKGHASAATSIVITVDGEVIAG